MAKLTGTNPDQVPTNADLGTMAYQDKDNLQVGDVEAKGTINFTDNVGVDRLHISGGGGGAVFNHNDNSPFKFQFSGGTEVVRIESGGNVGIGTASPSSRLETVQTGQNTTAVFSNTNASWANDVSFVYAPSGSTVSDLAISSRSNGSIWLGSGYGPIHFQLDENEANSRSTKVTIRSDGYLTLNGNDIGGTQVTIADDAVASITPPRTGGFAFITAQGRTDYPQSGASGFVFYDVGLSLQISEQSFNGGGANFDTSTSDVTGTTGTDGNVTVAAQSGVIKIENRYGSSTTFQITFL